MVKTDTSLSLHLFLQKLELSPLLDALDAYLMVTKLNDKNCDFTLLS